MVIATKAFKLINNFRKEVIILKLLRDIRERDWFWIETF